MDAAAACTLRPGLPWVAETAPSPFHQSQMRAVCNDCPIRRQCADYAARTMPTGFYAGVWIPGMGGGRSAALKMLRHVAGGTA
ncbi:WhiB family transcriptional regulator [Mycobacterium kansasii]